MEGLLSIDETASYFGLSTWTVRYMVKLGKLASVKVGRRVLIERSEIERFVAECKQPTGRSERRGLTEEV